MAGRIGRQLALGIHQQKELGKTVMPPAPPAAPGREFLDRLLAYCASASPYYRDQAWAARRRANGALDFHREIPITPKSAVRENTDSFHIPHVPEEDGAVVTDFTSGSTGEPIKILKTHLHFRMNIWENRRLKAGWGLERHRRILALEWTRPDKQSGSVTQHAFGDGGRRWRLYGPEDVSAVKLLHRTQATMITGFPSIVHETLKLAHEQSLGRSLRLVATKAEAIGPGLREFARQAFDCRVLDRYGAVEAGLIAVQCSACDEYHFADRHLLVEVVKDDDSPAAPGEVGRLLLTTLYNRAMPLLRYDIGDYVELSRNESCPRSNRSVRRIVGRERNIFKLADGRRLAPTLPAPAMLELGIRRFKLIQTTLRDVELYYVAAAEVPELTQEAAQRLIDHYVDPSVRADPRRVSDIPRNPGGKLVIYESKVE
jgi:phenylacetate-CoA ligase